MYVSVHPAETTAESVAVGHAEGIVFHVLMLAKANMV